MGVVGLRDLFVVAPAASFHAQAAQHHQESLFSSQEHPIIPLLTAAPCLVDDPHDSRAKSAGIHLWQQQQQQQQQSQNHHLQLHGHGHGHGHHQQQQHNSNPNPNPNPYLKRPVPMLETAGILSTTSSSGGGATCQDCGNQAKKDCSHRRCRTCCKSRGFDCSTHVKSTWVPAARRRERQLSAGPPAAGSSASTSAPKKPRLLSSQTTTTSHTSTSNTTRSLDTSSSQQDASFRESLPGQVRAPAVFKCVRVTSIEDDGEDEYAYQAMVKIGGHVFKGFLYDQGTDDGRGGGGGEHLSIAGVDNSNNGNNAIPNISELHLGGGASTSGVVRSSSAMVPAGDMSGLLGEAQGCSKATLMS